MRRGATQAERALWETAMRGVRRMHSRAPSAISGSAPVDPISAGVPAQARPANPTPRPVVSRNVDRATLDRLRRGQIAIDARIDLHGMTQAEAFSVLIGFVGAAARAGRRALLVITGKGTVSQGGGVLRRNAPAWLMASPLGGRILAVVPAHRRHGGDGAFYVMLRRIKPERPSA